MLTKKTLYILIVVVLSGLFLWQIFLNTTTTIYRTQFGFIPSSISVPVGTEVTFKNISGALMWPASDIHPAHTAYSDFDAQEMIPPGESWSFEFDRRGKWKFHDHVASQFTGAVTVSDSNGDSSFDCTGEDKESCWLNEIEDALISGGAPAAFAALVDIHQAYPEFASGCHNYSHDIGLKTFVYFGPKAEFGPEISYCNAGFLHGFMEGMIDDVNQFAVALEYCSDLGERLSSEFPLAQPQCLHGVGHGVMEYYINNQPELLAQPNELLSKTVAVCDGIEDPDGQWDNQMRCASGAFNVYRDIIKFDESYPQLLTEGEVFSICAFLKEDYKKRGCYWEMAKLYTSTNFLKQFLDGDAQSVHSAFSHISNSFIDEDEQKYLGWATRSWAMIIGKWGVSQYPPETIAAVCDAVPEAVRPDCLLGVSEGLFTSSEPHMEYQHLNSFCALDSFSDSEQSLCFEDFIKNLSLTYSDTEMKRQCALLPIERQEKITCENHYQ